MQILASNLGLSLVLGLMIGLLFKNPALGALGGLLFHLVAGAIFNSDGDVNAEE